MVRLPFRPTWPRTIISLIPFLALMQGIVGPRSIARAASDYDCQQIHGHCAGVLEWVGRANGADTSIYHDYANSALQPGINNDGSSGIINTELWFYGPAPSGQQCMAFGIQSNGNLCWIETGIHNGSPLCANAPSTPCYFFADDRPCSGCTNNYFEHPIADEPIGDQLGTLHASIYGPGGSDGHTYTVYTGTPSFNLYNFSTGQTMQVDVPSNMIVIGAEAGSQSGAVLPYTQWQYNYWLGGSTWNLQTNYGQPGPARGQYDPTRNLYAGPIVSGWVWLPGLYNDGGNWGADCPDNNYAC